MPEPNQSNQGTRNGSPSDPALEEKDTMLEVFNRLIGFVEESFEWSDEMKEKFSLLLRERKEQWEREGLEKLSKIASDFESALLGPVPLTKGGRPNE